MSGDLILIVDDEPNIVQLARMVPESEEYHIQSVSDARSALEYTLKHIVSASANLLFSKTTIHASGCFHLVKA
jgi:CheY-like chemotaxis protein